MNFFKNKMARELPSGDGPNRQSGDLDGAGRSPVIVAPIPVGTVGRILFR